MVEFLNLCYKWTNRRTNQDPNCTCIIAVGMYEHIQGTKSQKLDSKMV